MLHKMFFAQNRDMYANLPAGCAVSTTIHPRWDESFSDAYYGTNNFNLSIYPGGVRGFTQLGESAYFWTSTGASAGRTYSIQMNHEHNEMDIFDESNVVGMSIRLMTDYSGPLPDGSVAANVFTDGSGFSYAGVVIGNQVWLTSNLITSKTYNGTDIPEVTNDADWLALTTRAWCWYNNTASSYGKLYNAYAIINLTGTAPGDYRVPSRSDWETLRDYLSNTYDIITNATIARYLKACRQVNHPLA